MDNGFVTATTNSIANAVGKIEGVANALRTTRWIGNSTRLAIVKTLYDAVKDINSDLQDLVYDVLYHDDEEDEKQDVEDVQQHHDLPNKIIAENF